jgi:hypothetical protein
MSRFLVQTRYNDGMVSNTSSDSYNDASWAYDNACKLVTWYSEATSVSMIDREQSTDDHQHVLHRCSDTVQY